VGWAVCLAWWIVVAAAGAEPPPTTPDRPVAGSVDLKLPEQDPGKIDLDQTPSGTKSLLTTLVVDNLPGDYEDTKKWGQTRKRWDGLHIRIDGLKVDTKRRWKTVNHGTWQRYRVTLVDPEEHLRVRVVHLHRVGPGKIGFDLLLDARLNVWGRLQEWNNGLRLFSLSGEAQADVELQLGVELATTIDPTRFPPDVLLQPKVDSARIDVRSFRLKRISKADGPLVRELGDSLENVVRKKLAEKNVKLAAKINRQIDKKKDDLRLSLHDLVQHKWLGLDGENDQE
jgi:hypothetical protein